MKRRPNRSGSKPYRLPDGRWRSEVQLGIDASGARIRRVVTAPTAALVETKMRRLLTEADAGLLVTGPALTLEAWLTHWLDEIAAPTLRPRTLAGYRSYVRTWISGTRLAATRLDKVTAEDLDALYARMRAAGRSGSTVLQMHRILSRAFKVAVRRGRLAIAPTSRVDAPAPSSFEPQVFGVDEARALVARAAKDGELGWILALALGPRQGERLGLGWDQVDLEAGRLRFTRSLVMLGWSHGCGGSCGRKRGAECPQRTGGYVLGPPKSRAGVREWVLPAPLVAAFRVHRERQLAGRAPHWRPFQGVELVFAHPDGSPISPSVDYRRWQAFLARAGVAPARVHDARHTAATVMLVLGEDPRVVMELMGWSQASMLARYQHVVDELRSRAAGRLEAALWPSSPPPEGGAVVVSLADRRARRSR